MRRQSSNGYYDYYIGRFQAALIALVVLVVWWNMERLLKLPSLILDGLCYLLCERRIHRREASQSMKRAAVS